MDAYAEWINPHTKERCRIKFDIEINVNASSNTRKPLWSNSVVGSKLKILDSAFYRGNYKRGDPTKFRVGSTVYIDSEITTPEIIEGIKAFMKEIYAAKEESLVVELSL